MLIVFGPLYVLCGIEETGDLLNGVFLSLRLGVPFFREVDEGFVVVPVQKFFSVVGELRSVHGRGYFFVEGFVFVGVVNKKFFV